MSESVDGRTRLGTRAALSAAFGALLLLGATGCEADCRAACRHMLEGCGVERPGLSVDDCSAQCEDFLVHYEDRWQEPNAKDAVRCVERADCAALREGTPCYDPAVYIW